MVGLDITIACPCCKKLSGVNIGITEYYNYNSKIYAMVSCPKCRKKLLVNDNSNAVSSFDLIQMNGNGYIVRNCVLEYLFNNFVKCEEMSEEELETLLYTIVKKECGYSDNTKYEYEIKSIIQRCISQYLHNNKLKDIYVYDEIKDNCSYETTICW